MLRLVTFGGLALERSDGASPPRVRPQRLAILAVLAAAGDRGVSRERMCGLLWPDTSEERARHALRQALYALRQEVDADIIQTEPVLTLDRRVVAADVAAFRAALSAGDSVRAVHLVTGPFLHGFYLPSAPGFERWVEEERAAILTEATRALLALAKESSSSGAHDAAAEWWRRLTVLDPLSGRFALGYLKALAAQGDRAGALAFARAHESVVRRELEADPDPEIRHLEAELRALPSPGVARGDRRQETGDGRQGRNDGSAQQWEHQSPDVRLPVHRRWRAPAIALVTILVTAVLAANVWERLDANRNDRLTPTFAVGMIREDGIPDTLRIGGVLTDMLATNLARVAGLSVLGTSRLYELMLPGQDTLIAGYAEAARRAGATEILQGRLLSGPQWGLAMELQRVDLGSGIVRGAYRVAADDRYALVDSMTAAIARDLRLQSPGSSVADATTDSPIAYRLYEEGLRAYYQYDGEAARRLMQSALQEDSTFAMAAYYEALLVSGGSSIEPRQRALRLAQHAPERERLRITANLLALNMEPSAVAVAESLITKFPGDPRAFELLGEAYWFRGDWQNAAKSYERAVALDSASEPIERQNCRLCNVYMRLSDTYFWWDSLPAAERTAQRLFRARPNHHGTWDILTRVAAVRGDTAGVLEKYRRFYEANPIGVDAEYLLRQSILMEDYDRVEKDAQPLLHSPRSNELANGRWLWSIALRNQGRLAEAAQVARQHRQNDTDHLLEVLVAIDQGNARQQVAILDTMARRPGSEWRSAIQARYVTWNKTLFGMALIAAGDTSRLRYLADTVEAWGQRSLYGRDRKAHHYLRGMLLVARHRDAEAVEELRQAIHSPSHGFTRINLELGRTLLRLNQPAEAVPVVRAALHGGVDGSNLYVTRTELHEVLAEAFDRLGNRDSATVHYGAVARAWAKSDPMYRGRLNKAREWLAANARSAPSQHASR